MRTELVSTVAHAEAYNTQSSNWRVKYYAVEWDERHSCQHERTPYVRYWWQLADSVLRWEQLYARKGNSLTLPTSTVLVVRSC